MPDDIYAIPERMAGEYTVYSANTNIPCISAGTQYAGIMQNDSNMMGTSRIIPTRTSYGGAAPNASAGVFPSSFIEPPNAPQQNGDVESAAYETSHHSHPPHNSSDFYSSPEIWSPQPIAAVDIDPTPYDLSRVQIPPTSNYPTVAFTSRVEPSYYQSADYARTDETSFAAYDARRAVSPVDFGVPNNIYCTGTSGAGNMPGQTQSSRGDSDVCWTGSAGSSYPPSSRRWSVLNNMGSAVDLVEQATLGDRVNRPGEQQTVHNVGEADDRRNGRPEGGTYDVLRYYINDDEGPWSPGFPERRRRRIGELLEHNNFHNE
ncbi:hypothetical protein AAE478_008808 [Parahypoxylon ruwenzoriense]